MSPAAHLVNPNQGAQWWRKRRERLAVERDAGYGHEDREDEG